MSSRWNKPDIPHKGWVLINSFDTGSADEVCEMCDNVGLRYLHKMLHAKTGKELHVGVICAGKMSDDYFYELALNAEKRFKKKERLRAKFKEILEGEWLSSKWGNEYVKFKDNHVCVFRRMGSDQWGYVVNSKFCERNEYPSAMSAKRSALGRLYKDLTS